ncbi:MAG TPA: peptidoglycan-binding domain-containing protein, partial [Bryobacteraceae bacterium]
AKKNAPRATWRNRQMQPTPDRYKDIQNALAAKGYLRPEEATGKWEDNSVEALKRFQGEQNIEATGKINSLSLIALGLGPKHESTGAAPPPPAAR